MSCVCPRMEAATVNDEANTGPRLRPGRARHRGPAPAGRGQPRPLSRAMQPGFTAARARLSQECLSWPLPQGTAGRLIWGHGTAPHGFFRAGQGSAGSGWGRGCQNPELHLLWALPSKMHFVNVPVSNLKEGAVVRSQDRLLGRVGEADS